MRIKAVVEDEKLRTQFKLIEKQSKNKHDGGVMVGYTQKYAIHVHEKQMHHEEGSWKYLQKAYEEEYSNILRTVKGVMEKTGSLKQGLAVAGLRIQRTSQKKYCPVDTGALKNSAWTAAEENVHQKSREAKERGDQVRADEMAKRESES